MGLDARGGIRIGDTRDERIDLGLAYVGLFVDDLSVQVCDFYFVVIGDTEMPNTRTQK